MSKTHTEARHTRDRTHWSPENEFLAEKVSSSWYPNLHLYNKHLYVSCSGQIETEAGLFVCLFVFPSMFMHLIHYQPHFSLRVSQPRAELFQKGRWVPGTPLPGSCWHAPWSSCTLGEQRTWLVNRGVCLHSPSQKHPPSSPEERPGWPASKTIESWLKREVPAWVHSSGGPATCPLWVSICPTWC